MTLLLAVYSVYTPLLVWVLWKISQWPRPGDFQFTGLKVPKVLKPGEYMHT